MPPCVLSISPGDEACFSLLHISGVGRRFSDLVYSSYFDVLSHRSLKSRGVHSMSRQRRRLLVFLTGRDEALLGG